MPQETAIEPLLAPPAALQSSPSKEISLYMHQRPFCFKKQARCMEHQRGMQVIPDRNDRQDMISTIQPAHAKPLVGKHIYPTETNGHAASAPVLCGKRKEDAFHALALPMANRKFSPRHIRLWLVKLQDHNQRRTHDKAKTCSLILERRGMRGALVMATEAGMDWGSIEGSLAFHSSYRRCLG